MVLHGDPYRIERGVFLTPALTIWVVLEDEIETAREADALLKEWRASDVSATFRVQGGDGE